MTSSNLIQQLQERGLIAQVTDEDALTETANQRDRLVSGILKTLQAEQRYQMAQMQAVSSGIKAKLNTSETVNEWVKKIRQQVAPFLDFDCGSNSAIRQSGR
jgi:tyrosyl-tRNA synthetase